MSSHSAHASLLNAHATFKAFFAPSSTVRTTELNSLSWIVSDLQLR
jgi:hypothetical protein